MGADWAAIAVRFALYAALSELFGLSAFGLYAVPSGERGHELALGRWLGGAALAGLLLSAVGLTQLAGAMAGTPAWPPDRAALGVLLSGSAVGTAWQARMVALLIALAAVPFAAGRARVLVLIAVPGAVALATLAWAGHGAMDEGVVGWMHLAADVLHLLAAGAWSGALLGLVLLVTRPLARADGAHLRTAYRALHGFGAIGTGVVGTIVATGLVNAWLLVGPGHLASLATTLYGRLLVLKLALFGAMLGLAALNRFRLTPRFERSLAARDHAGALGALRRSLAVETASATAILALVAWLGTLEPPAAAI